MLRINRKSTVELGYMCPRSSDTHQVVEIQIETSTKMYTPFLTERFSVFYQTKKNKENVSF